MAVFSASVAKSIKNKEPAAAAPDAGANIAQIESLRLLRGEMDHFVRNKFTHWGLSPAERDIAMYMLKGLSISEIATARATAEGTIKAQSSSIFRKTGVNSRTELMSLFMDEFLDVVPESNL